MAIYYILLAAIVGLGFFFGGSGSKAVKRAAYVAAVSLALALVAGLRYGIGFDYYTYQRMFQEIAGLSFPQALTFRVEPGFTLLTRLLLLFSQNGTFINVCYALLGMAVVGAVIYRRSEIPWLSFFAFVCLMFFSSSMNLLRQTLAAILFLPAVEFLQNKKIVPYMAIVLLAATFHKSALLLIPVYFIANLPLNRVTGAIYGAGALLCFAFSRLALGLVFQVAFKSYAVYLDNPVYAGGSSPTYVAVPILLAVLVILLHKRLLRKDPRNIVYVNFMIYGGFFSLMMLRHFILERFAIFFMITAILLLPTLVETFRPAGEPVPPKDGKFRSDKAQAIVYKKQRKEQTQIYYSVLAGFSLLLFLHFGMAANFKFHNVFPYYSIFSPEAKSGQKIEYIPYGYTLEDVLEGRVKWGQ